MFLEWSKDYEINIDKMDTHHKRLVDIINRLGEAYSNERSSDVMQNIMGNLISYGNYHFSIEELVMKRNTYPRYELHKKEHEMFIKNIKGLMFKYQIGDQMALKTMIDYLNNWLIGHIMVEDRQYSFSLKDKF